MPSFKTSHMVMDNLDHLYAYLKGRSDGAIKRAKVELMPVIAEARDRSSDATAAHRLAARVHRRSQSSSCAAICRQLFAAQETCCRSARIRTICRSPTERGEGFENRIAELFAAEARLEARILLLPAAHGIHPQHAALQAARRRLSLRSGDRRARQVRPGLRHQALLSLDLRAGLSAGRQARRRALASQDLVRPRPEKLRARCASACTIARRPSDWLNKHGLRRSGRALPDDERRSGVLSR